MTEREKDFQRILAATLDNVIVKPSTTTSKANFEVHTQSGQSIALQTKWAGAGWPQDVRRLAAEVAEPWPTNVVLLAHRFSPGAIEWLRERGANWADAAGQTRILGPNGLIVIREPAQLPKTASAPGAFTWSKSAVTIGEMLLTCEDRPLRVAELAEKTDWSVAQVGKVLQAFDQQGWTVKQGTRRGPDAYRSLIDADGLLAAWTAAVTDPPRMTRIAHRATADVMALLRNNLAPTLELNTSWAVTGWAGLELTAPYATMTPNLHLYIDEADFARPLSNAIEAAGLREVDQGGRVTFWAANNRLLKLAKRIEGIPVVSAPRLFADLTSFGGRGGDAADHIKEQLLNPLHLNTQSK